MKLLTFTRLGTNRKKGGGGELSLKSGTGVPSQRKQYIGESAADAIASHKKRRSSLPAALAPGASSGLPAALRRNVRRIETALLRDSAFARISIIAQLELPHVINGCPGFTAEMALAAPLDASKA